MCLLFLIGRCNYIILSYPTPYPSTAPQLTKGYWRAWETVQPDKTFIVAPVTGHYPKKNNVEVCSLMEVIERLDIY